MVLVNNRGTNNPYINLAIEEYLVRHADCSQHDYLLLYINEPCIVIGKNQSIYREVNFDFLRNGVLKLARRISGGGTVYQDSGNLSFSFISQFTNEKINNYKYFNRPVVDALVNAGVEAYMDKRNNILCQGRKISGNAQFTNRKNIISHGTLLLNADVVTLGKCLRMNEFKIETNAVASVRSPVMNLADVTDRFSDTVALSNYLIQQLPVSGEHHFTDDEWSVIVNMANEKFNSFKWIYGRSPYTTITKPGIRIEVEDGCIKRIQIQEQSFEHLMGIQYDYSTISSLVNNGVITAGVAQLIF